MKNKSYEGLTIRVPINVAMELRKLKKGKDLPSYGLALQYWIRQQLDEQIETRLINIEKKLDDLLDEIALIEDRAVRTDEKAVITAGYLTTILEQLDGKGGAKSYIDRLEKTVELDIHELLEQRKIRRLKVAEHRKSKINKK